ncbi:MAG: rhamnogalacturonan lyase, partial [Prevotella sp.]|nr:rhamnogalacturonan lyase [Prevotella sp.]
ITRIMIRGNLTHPCEVAAPVQSTGTIQWAFDGGGANQTATIPNDFQGYVTTAVNKGSTLKYAGTCVCSDVTETLMGTNIGNEMNANSGNALTFSITPASDCTFKATSVSFTATRIGTDGSSLNASYDGTTLVSGVRPARNNANPPYTVYTFNVDGEDSESVQQFIINIYQLGSTKQVGIANVSVTGVLTHPAGPANAKRAAMDEEEQVTAIDTPMASVERKVEGWYTLQGVKIDQPAHPGIYIFNGKKVVVR